ncbi:MAG: universal stress protein [Cyanobacteria bacterium P01_G01_bin.19]
MYDKILVAIDRSETSRQVFMKALSVAKADGATLILLHVLSKEESTSPFMSDYMSAKKRCIHVPPETMRHAKEVYRKEWVEFEQQGIEILRSYAKKAISAGVKTEFTQITGHPSSTICEFARSCDADLITIGRRGRSGLQEMLLGSVSNYVVHHAPCSILLVQTPVVQESASANEIGNAVYV